MKRRWITIFGITIVMAMTTTGCSGEQKTADNTETEIIHSLSFNDSANSSDNSDIDGPVELPQDDETLPADLSEQNTVNPNAVFIGGKVRSVSQDSFVISRTLVEDSMVTMPEPGSPDEVLVTVRCSASAVYEHWTIQGGGAGITKTDAAFSDIKIGDGLEAEGSFDGEEFVAERVIIELYQ